MKFADRLLTIVITATLTSAIWIIFGGTMIESASEKAGDDSDVVAEADSPEPGGVADGGDAVGASGAGEPGAPPPAIAEASPEEQALPVEAGDIRMPVRGVQSAELSDTFFDERGGGARKHEAIDIMADDGTAVVAAAPGTIAKLHQSGPGGNSIYVRSEDRLTIYYYAHLNSYASGLREGQTIRTGQDLGTVGSTGNADPSAPHLHFAIMETTADARWWEPANAVNPYPLLTAAR
ncbi:peptidoglycan DD-metalloendopeptidase family protein [Erythrobacter sp.]|nr:peptidoglycan DD-metalloendopeptidase family protein [Erythrobacter sp.]